MISDAYKRSVAGQTPQYEFQGDRWWQIGPDVVQPLTDAATGQMVPGTTISLDTSMGQKYLAFPNQGFDQETALGAVSGRYDLRVTEAGIPIKVDQLTNQGVLIQRHGPSEISQRQQLGPTPGRQ